MCSSPGDVVEEGCEGNGYGSATVGADSEAIFFEVYGYGGSLFSCAAKNEAPFAERKYAVKRFGSGIMKKVNNLKVKFMDFREIFV